MKNKLHQIYDVSALLTIIAMGCSGIWYFAHDHAKLDFLSQQITEVKESQNKILEILITRNNNGH